MRFFLVIFLIVALAGCDRSKCTATLESHPENLGQPDKFRVILASLIDPDKLATLTGKRAATPRLRKACYWLQKAKEEGHNPSTLIDQGHGIAQPQDLDREAEQKAALLRNLAILERLGCLDAAGKEKLRRGRAPTITRGPYAGELATGDHIIPRSVCPELDNHLMNLEFMPETLNRRKAAKIGERQLSIARRWHSNGLLSPEGMEAVERAFK